MAYDLTKIQKFNRIVAFGDSWVQGWMPKEDNIVDPNDDKSMNEASFIGHLSRHFNVEYKNFARVGCSNMGQYDRFVSQLYTLDKSDLIIFGITVFARERAFWYEKYEELKKKSPYLGYANRYFYQKFKDKYKIHDAIMLLSSLQHLITSLNLNAIIVNLFCDDLIHMKWGVKDLEYEYVLKNNIFPNFLDFTKKSNTLINVLSDSYGDAKKSLEISNFVDDRDESKWQHHKQMGWNGFFDNHKQFFTSDFHPNIEGHKKIGSFLSEVIESKLCL